MLNIFKQSGLRWLWVAVLALLLDQITKQWVIRAFELYESVQVLPFFNLTYVRNYGAAFSFLSDAGGWQRWFFTAIAIVVSVVLLWWLKQSKKHEVLLPVAYCLILSGAIGNVTDRLIYGYVIDFLDFYYQQWHYPAFNIADSAIFIGAGLLIYDAFFRQGADSEKNSESK
ncbi:signal peptidase II [Planctobacterium marinum]|uniref:Lipoprotein signal peptidase n=1 Tax=Planctobacterium marinum TaxID=1631968 RepID=A0AA48HI23_9ALTE|nr:lipoprotein signal peptidase [Planctobacterium marinum]